MVDGSDNYPLEQVSTPKVRRQNATKEMVEGSDNYPLEQVSTPKVRG